MSGSPDTGSLYRQLLISNVGIAGFAVVVFLVCIAMNIALQRQANTLATVRVPANALTAQLAQAIEASNTSLRQWILLNDKSHLNHRAKLWQQVIPENVLALSKLCEGHQLKMLESLALKITRLDQSQQAVVRLFGDTRARRIGFITGRKSAGASIDAQLAQAMKLLRNETEPVAAEIGELLQSIRQGHNLALAESGQRLAALVQIGTYGLSVGVLSLILFAWILARRNTNSVVKPIKELISASDSFARTLVLPKRLNPAGPQEIAQLQTSFIRTATELTARTRALLLANEEMAAYAQVITHDLKPPIINITGHARQISSQLNELIKPSSPGGSEATQTAADQHQALCLAKNDIAESAQFIDSSVKKLNELISGVTTSSRIALRPVSLGAVDTKLIVEQVADLFSHRFREVDIEIGDLPTIDSDQFFFEHIMSNLIDNAFKFLQPDRRGLIEISANVADHRAHFNVSDNGRGIPTSPADVFALFRRFDTTVEGSGVGLALVRSMVGKLGGEITYRRNETLGVTFTFWLPNSASDED